MIEITIFTKEGGPLTKRISLNQDGSLKSDGSQCIMPTGVASRFRFAQMQDLAAHIRRLQSDQAIATGTLRADLPDRVEVVTKTKLNGANHSGIIARTQEYLIFRPGEPALALVDFDAKGMPPATAARIKELGGFRSALGSVMPALATVARVERASTSAGLFDSRTGRDFPGSGGMHVYLLIRNGADNERFLQALHARCWLGGFGWMMVGAGGQLLERSIVDRVVGSPERLAFEGPPVLLAPVAQDKVSRRPIAIEGEALDTIVNCPPLTTVELAKLRELRAKEAQRLAAQSAKAREVFVQTQSRWLARRTGMDLPRARRTIERQIDGVLLPDIELPFDDEELAGKTVADVLAAPACFEGETLADPVEGVEYGRCKARIMRRAAGSVWINSFAHGRTVYELQLDYPAVRAALERASKEDITDTFLRLALAADLREDEIERLKQITAERSDVGVRALAAMLRVARQVQAARQAQLDRERRLAERHDPRPQIRAPAADDDWLPQMKTLNDVLGQATDPEPPMRNVDGAIVVIRERRTPKLHAFSTLGANQEETEDTRLPAPEQPLLTQLTEPQLAEFIERHIDYVDGDGRSVHLNTAFVKHFHVQPDDDALPLASAVVTLPLVLGDGTLLKKPGFDRERGIVFRVATELSVKLPEIAACTDSAVAEAMQYLTGVWLCDVATDYPGKCNIIAAALTVIERSLLPDRPIFWVTSGRRGGGKTTTLIMLLVALTGIRPAAAAWSPNEEERRKALLAYLLEGLPALIWDNIPNGQKIACPHIERSCTTAWYSDRRLGVSETVACSASTIHLFTGNNVGPRRDLASRSLHTRIIVDRPDPENRTFSHPDPIGWTQANRGTILTCLYTLLLGNPLFAGKGNPPQTRFKTWWSLVGQAVENAATQHCAAVTNNEMTPLAKCPPRQIEYKKLLLDLEQDDDDSRDLAASLAVLAKQWPKSKPFSAAELASFINITGDAATLLRDFLFPTLSATQAVSAKSVGKRLKRYLDEPIEHDRNILILQAQTDTHTKTLAFHVATKEIPF